MKKKQENPIIKILYVDRYRTFVMGHEKPFEIFCVTQEKWERMEIKK